AFHIMASEIKARVQVNQQQSRPNANVRLGPSQPVRSVSSGCC
ncbi:putative small GTP binding protein rab1a, partial [Toxoplasma gondii TgCatPRC2]